MKSTDRRLSDAELCELERLEREATPGKWKWTVNLTSKSVHIESTGQGSWLEHVLSFERWGMQSAKPLFLNKAKGLLIDVLELLRVVPGREHHKRWHQTIDHPDAIIMCEARNALPAILSEIRALRAENADWKSMAFDAGVEMNDAADILLKKNGEIKRLNSERARLRAALDKVRGIAMISAGWERALLADHICNVVNAALASPPAQTAAGETNAETREGEEG